MHEENTEHQPQLGFIRITVDDEGNVEKSLRSIKLRVKPAIEIFDMDKKAEEKKESEAIKLFVEKLATEAVAMNVQKGDVVENIIEQMNVASVIQDRVLHYIQLARSQKK
jgi:hypothetical protein